MVLSPYSSYEYIRRTNIIGGNGNGNGGSNGDTGGDDLIPGICPPEPEWVCFFLNNVAQDIFTPITVPENLPDGFDEALYKKLVEVLRDIKPKTMQQIDWLVKNPGAIDILSAYLALPSVGQGYDPENPNAPAPPAVDVLDLIDLCRSCGLNAEQFGYLLNNPGFYESMSSFIEDNGINAASKQALKSTINLQMHGWFDKTDWTDAELEYVLANEFEPALSTDLYIEAIVRYHLLRATDPRFKDPCGGWCQTKAWAQAIFDVSSGWVHTYLDILGLIPGGGEFADLANGVLYTFEGDGVNATLSFAAAMPITGWAATGAKYAGILIAFKNISHTLEIIKIGNFCDFGNRSDLRTVLNITNTNNEAHHIIPWDFRQLPIVQKAAESANKPYHMNHFKNGKELEKFRFDTNPNGVHANHPQYNEAVEAKMEQLWNNLVIHYSGSVPPDVASSKLIELQNSIETVIDANPNVKINLLNLSGVPIPNVP